MQRVARIVEDTLLWLNQVSYLSQDDLFLFEGNWLYYENTYCTIIKEAVPQSSSNSFAHDKSFYTLSELFNPASTGRERLKKPILSEIAPVMMAF